MNKPFLVRSLGLAAVLLLASAWILTPSQAQFRGSGGMDGGIMGGFGHMQPEVPKLPTPMVYVARPVSEADARILAALRQQIPMSFENETPLEDLLNYIKKETESDDLPKGLPIYVDPVGLMEAERTIQSPIQLNLVGIPLEKTLKLALDQLCLGYFIRDGMLLISAKESLDYEKNDPTTLLLNELAALRHEVFELRKEVKALQGQAR